MSAADAIEASDPVAFLDAALADADGGASPALRALAAGARADRLGYAFVAGYSAALVTLAGDRIASKGRWPRACVAATEGGGAHPRAIATTVTPDGDGFRLEGAKDWVTLGREAELAIVIAKEGEAEGRPVLRAVALPTSRAGVTLEATPPPPFVPEIGHARLVLGGVRVEAAEMLPGDGYADWLKPFRTIEDLHVQAALVGYLAGAWRRGAGAPRALAELVAIAIVVVDLAGEDAKSPALHVAVEGVLQLTRAWLERNASMWERVSPAEKERWERDRALLGVAGRARGERFARALARLAG
jgi:alkylation response protein AidB-like acyl-CoA dehydrogenase